MPKRIEDANIAILTCPFEPPKPKTKHKVDIDTVEKFQTMRGQEQKYFDEMVQKCKVKGFKISMYFIVGQSHDFAQSLFTLHRIMVDFLI